MLLHLLQVFQSFRLCQIGLAQLLISISEMQCIMPVSYLDSVTRQLSFDGLSVDTFIGSHKIALMKRSLYLSD